MFGSALSRLQLKYVTHTLRDEYNEMYRYMLCVGSKKCVCPFHYFYINSLSIVSTVASFTVYLLELLVVMRVTVGRR